MPRDYPIQAAQPVAPRHDTRKLVEEWEDPAVKVSALTSRCRPRADTVEAEWGHRNVRDGREVGVRRMLEVAIGLTAERSRTLSWGQAWQSGRSRQPVRRGAPTLLMCEWQLWHCIA